MAFSTVGRAPLKAEMNVTPMIDILLVLIIVFMVVVVSAFQSKGLDAQIPHPATKADNIPTPRTIVIQLAWAGDDKRPSLKINDESAAWDQLPVRLADIFAQRAERVAFVKGDDDVDFRYVAEAISIAKNSGVERVGLLSKLSAESPGGR
jgi:biopolymer transport protein TolR